MFSRLPVLTLLAAAGLLLCQFLAAQESGRIEKVSLRTDQSLQIFLELIQEARKEKDWDKALKSLAQIERFVEKNGDEYILPADAKKHSRNPYVALYTSAKEAAYRELAKFPEQALASWRLAADSAVQNALQKCRLGSTQQRFNPSQLEEVVAKYPLSKFSTEALHLLCSIYLERGDFPRALRACAHARAYFPGVLPEIRAHFELLRIVCLTLQSGEKPHALIERFNKDFAHMHMLLGGRQTPGARVLMRALSSIEPQEPAVPGLPGGIGLAKWSAALPADADHASQLQVAAGSEPGVGLFLSPVATGSCLLTCDDNTIAALAKSGGDVLWLHSEHGTPTAGSIHNMLRRPATDGRFVAASLNSRLCLFDVATGKLLWRISPEQEKGPGEQARGLHLSSPCIEGDTVLVGVSAWGQEMICSLLAYNLQDGSLRWRRRVVTGFPTNTFGLGSQPGPPVAWGGAAYFVTNLGAIICCDIKDGTIHWLLKYPFADARLKEDLIKSNRRWAPSAPRLHRGVVIAAPQDSPYLLALDATEGTLLWQEHRAGLESLTFLGGACGRLVYLSGSVLSAFDYRSGKLAWSAKLPEAATGPPAVFADRVIVPCAGVLAQFDPFSGRPLGSFHLPDTSLLPKQLADGDGCVFLASLWRVWRFESYGESLRAVEAALARNAKDPAALYQYGSLLWRTGKFEHAIETLIKCIASYAETDEPRSQAVQELLQALKAAAQSSKGRQRVHYLETAARYAPPHEQPSLLLEAAREFENIAAGADALRLYRKVLTDHPARSIMLSGHSVYASDYARICEQEILRRNPELRLGEETRAKKLLSPARGESSANSFLNVIRTFPNTEASSKAYIELGRFCIKDNLLESAEVYLKEFLARKPQSRLADQARALLCHIYLKKSNFAGAKQLLLALKKSGSEIEMDKTRQKASDYARRRLLLPKIAAANLGDSLLLPVSSLWQTTPCLAQRSNDIIGASKNGKFLYALGPQLLDCRSTETGALLSRLDLSAPTEPVSGKKRGIVVKDGVLLLRGKRLVMVEGKGQELSWKWGVTLPAPAARPGAQPREDVLFAKAAGKILVLWPANRLFAFEPATGSQAWKHESPAPYFQMPADIGGTLMLVKADGSAVLGLDPQAGKAKFTTRLEGRGFRVSSTVACGDYLVVIRGSRDLYCLNTSGRVLWTKRCKDFIRSSTYLPQGRLAVECPHTDKPKINCFDIKTGNPVWHANIDKNPAIQQLGDADNLYTVQRPKFGKVSVAAHDSATGKKRWEWRQPHGGYAAVTDSGNCLIVSVVDRMFSQIYFLDKSDGAPKQGLSFPAELYHSHLLRDGRLYVTTDRSAYCFGPVEPARVREEYINTLYKLSRDVKGKEELEKLAASYSKMRSFDNAARALEEIVRSNWEIPEHEIARLVQRAGGFHYGVGRKEKLIIEAPRVSGEIKIDGVLDDCWKPAASLKRSLGHVFGVDRPQGFESKWLSKHDLSATFYFGWDDKYFYFAVDAKDSIMRPWDKYDNEYWRGDLLLIALDSLGDGGRMARADDVLLSMGLAIPRRNLTKEEMEEEERHRPKGEYFVKRRDDDSGAIYEGKIPWELFNENGTSIDSEKGPAEGLTFGLDLVLLDDDTSGGTTKTLNLAGGLLLGKRSSLWRGFIPDRFAKIRLKGKDK